MLIEQADFQGVMRRAPFIPQRTVDVNDLPLNSSFRSTLPDVWMFDTVHADNAVLTQFQLPNPSEAVGHQGTHRTIAFHNLNEDGALSITDWDGNSVIALEYNEYAEFRITLEGESNGGKLISTIVPSRRFEYAVDAPNYGAAPSFANMPTWTDSANRRRMFPFNVNNIDILDNQAFTHSTTPTPNNEQGALADDEFFNHIGTMLINFDGLLTVEVSATLRLHTGATGSIAAYNGVAFIRVPASGSGATPIEEQRTDTFSGVGSERDYSVTRTLRVVDGERIFNVLRYNTDNTSLNSWGNCKIIHYNWIMELVPHIQKEWAA